MLQVVVVGAGHAGLAASWYLAHRGVEHVVLEAGRIGESWRSQRWDSFVLNSPTGLNRMPGDPGTADDPDPLRAIVGHPPDGFLARDAWVARLEAYARIHGLPVRTGVRVTSLEAIEGGGTLRLDTTAADLPTIDTRAVVVASGMQRVPRLPAAAAAIPASVVSIHTADYRRPEALPPGGVLVVGSAQSGGQISEELLAAGRRVIVAASAVPRVPRRYRGRDIFEWLRDIGFFAMTAEQLPDPRLRTVPQPIISGVGRYGHTLSLQRLAASGAELAGRLLGFDGAVASFADDLPYCVQAGDRASSDIRATIDRAIAAKGIAAPPANADSDPDDRAVADPAALTSLSRLDLATDRIGSVIWATGFRPDLDWMGPTFVSPDGAPRVTGLRSSVLGVWFLGVPWGRTRASAIVLGADQDAAAVADEVLAHIG